MVAQPELLEALGEHLGPTWSGFAMLLEQFKNCNIAWEVLQKSLAGDSRSTHSVSLERDRQRRNRFRTQIKPQGDFVEPE